MGCALLGAAVAGSIAMMLLGAAGVPVTALQAYGAALVVGVCLAVICSAPWLALAALLAGSVIALGLYRVRPWQAWQEMLRLMFDEGGGILAALRAEPALGSVLIGALLGGLAFAFARMQGGVYPLLTLVLVASLTGWYLSERIFAPQIMLSLFAIAAMFARSRDLHIPWRKILPLALIASLTASACVPLAGEVWSPMAEAAQKVRNLVSDYFRFTSPRTTYTVATDGFQPFGERLGGPATPLEHEVFEIDTDQTVLLRGSIKRSYTTYSWTDNGVNNRYLYLSPTKNGLKNRLFSADLADRADISGAFARVEMGVRFLADGSSSLFVPDILEDLNAPIEMAVYYNDTGEIFLTRDVQPGDEYTAVGLHPVHGAQMAEFLSQAEQWNDSSYDAIRAEYTLLPDGISQSVYSLAQQVVIGAQTPYEAACLLYEHLRSGAYTYALEVDYPPYGSDFVSHFLLDTKRGYCTYFATAMAVMARMVGLPSRYVEGYLVEPDADGNTIVTGEDAHAWTEIYFRGAGWIAFDPTPGSGENMGENGGNNSSDAPGSSSQPSAEPSSEPTPEPTPQGDVVDDLNDEPTPEPEPEVPEPTEEPIPEDEQSSGERGADEAKSNVWKILLWLVLLALAVLLALWRERETRPSTIARREKDAGARLLIWYRAMLDVLAICHLEPQPGETPIGTAKRLSAIEGNWSAFMQVSEVVAVCCYGNGTPNESAIELAQTAYADLLAQMPRRVRLKWMLHRMVKGMRDWRKIPE